MISTAHITQRAIKPYFEEKIIDWPDDMIRLHIGEHPFGASPHVVESLKKDIQNLHYYPSPTYHELRSKIADVYHVDSQNIICGNGSEELLHLIPKALISPGSHVVMPQFSFKGMSLGVMACGGVPIFVPQDIDKKRAYSADTILACITPQTRMIMIDHPGNPATVYLPESDIRLILKEALARNIFVLIDGAYDEYAIHSPGYVLNDAWVKEFPNTIILRTFSKAYALASLRLGWMHAASDVVSTIYNIRLPYHINTLAQKAGVYALEDYTYVKECARRTVAIRENFLKKIEHLNPWPSATNFVIIPLNQKACIPASQLKEKGVLTRPLEDYGLPYHLKIAMGMQKAMNILEDFFV